MLRSYAPAVKFDALHFQPHALFERGIEMELDLAIHAGDALPG